MRVPTSKRFHVLPEPVPHNIVDSNKRLHGWYPGKRECTAERLLVNPYNGCANDCFCCYAKALPGYFQLFRKAGITTVFRDFDISVSRQLDSLRVASCGYLSPVTDPFQSVDHTYRLSEKITRAFIERNVPIEFVTKSRVPDPVLDLMVRQPHSFCQFSFFTHKEDVRVALMKGGATCEQLFSEISRCRKKGLWVVCRIDPIIPRLTDARTDLEYLVKRAHDSGALHIVASVMDVPIRLRGEIWKHLENFGDGLVYDLQNLYSEKIDSTLHAKIEYRRGVFDWLRNCCDKLGIGFALCMEYELVDGVPIGLNKEFMNTVNCEGIDVPIYIRHDEKFVPAADCDGRCLTCTSPRCGIEDLAMGRSADSRKSFSLSDYRRWSQRSFRVDS